MALSRRQKWMQRGKISGVNECSPTRPDYGMLGKDEEVKRLVRVGEV